MTTIEKLERQLKKNEMAIDALGMVTGFTGLCDVIRSRRICELKNENRTLRARIKDCYRNQVLVGSEEVLSMTFGNLIDLFAEPVVLRIILDGDLICETISNINLIKLIRDYKIVSLCPRMRIADGRSYVFIEVSLDSNRENKED